MTLLDPVDSGRALFPLVHKTGRIGAAGMSGQAVNVVLARRATDAGYTAQHIAKLGGHSLHSGFVTEAFRQGAGAHGLSTSSPDIVTTTSRLRGRLIVHRPHPPGV